MLKKIAFGTYRTGLENPEHETALAYALDHGITTIDTSANYMFGDAERLIGRVLQSREREKMYIISKGGYIQGPNMQRLNEGMTVEELVPYDPSCYHSIHPGFLADQIDRSLERLESAYIDCYLLHNPEYYLMHSIKKKTPPQEAEQHRRIMQERIAKVFILLEEKVAEGKIKSYGISSNSFAKQPDDAHFLEYKNLIEYAQKAGGDAHHFRAIQLPMNLLERDGEAAAAWAKANGLEVYINRPLNAATPGGMIRLADYRDCSQFSTVMEAAQTIKNKEARYLIDQLLSLQDRFSWAGAVDDTLEYQVLPHIKNFRFDNDAEQKLLERFIICYRDHVKHSLNRKNRSLISGIPEETLLQEAALKWLLTHPYVDKVLIGMRQEDYVKEVLQLVSEPASLQ